MYTTADFRKGLRIEIDGKPFIIIESQHVKPGKGGAFVRTRLKNLQTGQVLEQIFRSGVKVNKPDLEQKVTEYLYQDGEQYVFMDIKNYEQIYVNSKHLGNTVKYLVPNVKVQLLYYKKQPIGLELATTMIMTVASTKSGVRGDTATSVTKLATMETGLVVAVPLFIEKGERLKIDTKSGGYIERA